VFDIGIKLPLIDLVLRKITNTIARYALLDEGDSVLVALSGGPDSVALMHLLSRLSKRMKLELTAVYINHQIRPAAVKKEEKFCRRLCETLNVPLELVSENIPALAKAKKKGLEEMARDFRYLTFDRLADSHHCHRIAVGHHADDRVETVLFRLLRGTGRTGLAGMPIRRGRIIRPLFRQTKDDILVYLKKHGLDYCLDQSNEGSDFKRNYIRNELLPTIRKNLNVRVDAAILNLAETAGDEEAYMEQVAQRGLRKAGSVTPGGKFELDLDNFNSYDLWVRRRMVRYCIAELSNSPYPPDKVVIDRLIELSEKDGRGMSLPGNVQAIQVGHKLVLHRRARIHFEQPLEVGRRCRLEVPRLDFRVRVIDRRVEKVPRDKRSQIVMLDDAKVERPLTVRNIRPGDRFVPLGMTGSKKVGDYLTDRKLDRVYRDEVPVVCDSRGIVWLVGYEIASRVKIDDKTRKVLEIGCTQRRQSSNSPV
jgi:tRNA(Ile)-lysidine synthase